MRLAKMRRAIVILVFLSDGLCYSQRVVQAGDRCRGCGFPCEATGYGPSNFFRSTLSNELYTTPLAPKFRKKSGTDAKGDAEASQTPKKEADAKTNGSTPANSSGTKKDPPVPPKTVPPAKLPITSPPDPLPAIDADSKLPTAFEGEKPLFIPDPKKPDAL